MVDATCLNDDCEKETWGLTKHPDDYASGVTCPECGTTRVEYDAPERREEPPRDDREQRGGRRDERREERRDEPRGRREEPPRETRPARREPAREARPARRDDNGLNTAEGLIATLDSEAPTEVRKKGVESLGGGVINLFKSALDYSSKKQQMAEQRATNADIQKTEDKPACECGYVFSAIGTDDERIQCPECGTEYEVFVE